MARKILLADDSVTAQNMGRKILADAGYEVITVNNGSAALKKIAEHKPDLIVLDVYMPGYSGLEVCQRLKEAQETARTPVLLTVGKLEPFKPEEARRVRADGFIVKPFEASELLSALSKLEDKIVPRGEASKPGRFARASAALDEGRYDRSTATDEDQGWKNRIQFPTKKEKPEQDEVDDSTIYNPVNKDLRTTFDHKTPAPAHSSKAEPRVDLGALAPEGLPKDVTPEEIAALAAAAAQVKGKLAEGKHELAAPEPVKDRASKPPQETKPEIKAETQPQASEQPAPAAPVEISAAAPPATMAGPKSQEPDAKQDESKKIEVPVAKSSEPPEGAPATATPASVATEPPAPSPAEVMAAIASLESDSGSSSASISGSGSGTLAVDSRKSSEPFTEKLSDETDDEPVTMAVAPQAGQAAQASRWSAVAVALTPDEAVLSLDLEMQKAYAAFAAAEAGHTVPTASATTPTEPVAEIPLPTPEAVTEPSMPVPASAAAEAIAAAVQELEAKSAAYVARNAPQTIESGPTTPAPVEKIEAPPEVASPIAAMSESAPEPVRTDAISENQSEAKAELSAANTAQAEPNSSRPESQAAPEITSVEAPAEARAETQAQAETQAETKIEAKQEAAAESSPREEVRFARVASRVDEIPSTLTHQNEVSKASGSEPPATERTAKATRTGEPSHESDIATTTAAAWASWRQIRQSAGSPKSISEKDAAALAPPVQDATAMAVAAGAETRPKDSTPDQSNDEVASIVDSVLAGLRPKIFEEISRKMGKK